MTPEITALVARLAPRSHYGAKLRALLAECAAALRELSKDAGRYREARDGGVLSLIDEQLIDASLARHSVTDSIDSPQAPLE